jgi:hypothetical protein
LKHSSLHTALCFSTKTKTTKKQKVGCWLGDLAKTKTLMLAENTAKHQK